MLLINPRETVASAWLGRQGRAASEPGGSASHQEPCRAATPGRTLDDSHELGAWHDPPPKPPPPAVPGPYTYEPCADVDPTPDYENVLTD